MRIILILLIAFFLGCNSSKKPSIIGETEYQQKMNAMFKDGSKSPLRTKDLKNFKGLDFFPIDSNFVVKAELNKIEDAPVFRMKTTTDRAPYYKEYGVFNFKINEKEYKLTAYQSQEDLKNPQLKNLLFIPFTDETSGEESYGGGRYMDVLLTEVQPDGTFILDFNETYNPYCIYDNNYSCPITPRKNHLAIRVTAGIKNFKSVYKN